MLIADRNFLTAEVTENFAHILSEYTIKNTISAIIAVERSFLSLTAKMCGLKYPTR